MSQQHRLAIQVPREAVGFIIGRHGETVRDLSSRSGAFIAVDESTPINRHHNAAGVFNITGSSQQIQRAHELISEKVNAILYQPPPAADLLLSPTTVSENTREDGASDDEHSPYKSEATSAQTARPRSEESSSDAGKHHTPSDHPPPSSEISTPQSTTASSAPVTSTSVQHHPQLTPSSSPHVAPAVAIYKPKRPPTEMWIPSEKVGMVIGQKGQVIRALQEKSDATIVVHNQNEGAEGSKLITISGNEHNCHVAKGLIDEVLNRDQRNMGVGSPSSSSVGRRGRNSSYARNIGGAGSSANRASGGPRLSERTYPHDVGGLVFANRYESSGGGTQPFAELVTTPPSHVSPHPFEHAMGDTPPPFSPPPPGMHPAEQRHHQDNPVPININIPPPGIMHPSFFPPQHPAMVPAGPYGQLTYGRPSYPQPQMQVKPVCVPTSCVGIVIGKGGETIRDLQSRSGAYIKVTPDREANSGDKERRILITGPANAVELAHNLLNDIVNEGLRRSYRDGAGAGPSSSGDQQQEREGSSSGEGSTNAEPAEAAASAEGNEGSTGATSLQGLKIDGEYRIVEQPQTEYPSTSISIELSIPNAKVGVIIGKGGQTIRELQQRSGARIVISKKMDLTKEDNPRMVTITGPAAFVEMAHKLIQGKIRGEGGSESGVSDSAGAAPMNPVPPVANYFHPHLQQHMALPLNPVNSQPFDYAAAAAAAAMQQRNAQMFIFSQQQQQQAAAAFQQQQHMFVAGGGVHHQQGHSGVYPTQQGMPAAALYPFVHQAAFSPQNSAQNMANMAEEMRKMQLTARAAQENRGSAAVRDEAGGAASSAGALAQQPGSDRGRLTTDRGREEGTVSE